MIVDFTKIVSEAFSQPLDGIFYRFSLLLSQAHPDQYILETEDWAFDVDEDFPNIKMMVSPDTHSQISIDHFDRAQQIHWSEYNTCLDIEWEGHNFKLMVVRVSETRCSTSRKFLLTPNKEIAEKFFLKVCQWNSEVRGEVLTYNDGWRKDSALFHSIKASTLDNLVLEGDLKEQIRQDFEDFFVNRETYGR